MRLYWAPLLALCSCGDGGGGGNVVIVEPMPTPPPPAQWQFQFSPGLTAPAPYGTGGFIFSFPSTDGAHYLVKSYSAPVSLLKADWTLTMSSDAVFNHKPDACGSSAGSATMTMYIQQAGDTGQDQNGRWFAWPIKANLSAGTYSMQAATRDNESWSNVLGKKQSEVGFSLSAMVPWVVGVTFGGGCAAGHGAWVNPGSASIAVGLFEVQ